MRKQFDINEMKRIFKATLDAGLFMHGNFLFGTPGENKSTIRETREFMVWLERLIHRQKQVFKTHPDDLDPLYIRTPLRCFSPGSNLQRGWSASGAIPERG